MLQRKSATRSGESSESQGKTRPAPAGRGLASSTHRVLNSPGESLDSQTRDFFEPRFHHDFSRVRVHTDGEAAASARAISASAYTVSQHMVFDSGKYQPHTRQGRELMAHELTHTIQQDQAATAGGQLALGDPADESEREAGRVASVAVNEGPVAIRAQRPLSVQRQPNSAAAPNVDLAELVSPFLAGAIGSVSIDGFETGKADISGPNQAALSKTAKTMQTLLRQYPGSTVRVIGYTDAVGQESDNQTLGQARADSVQGALVGMGIPAEILNTESRGAAELLVNTKKGEPRNRRVEVRFRPSSTFKGASAPAPAMGRTPDLSQPRANISGDFRTQFPESSPPAGNGVGLPEERKGGGGPRPQPLRELPRQKDICDRIDWSSINAAYTSHGGTAGDRGAVCQKFQELVRKYKGMGLPEDYAAKAANSELSSGAGSTQSHDAPNALDRSNEDWKAAHPNTPTVGPFFFPYKWKF